MKTIITIEGIQASGKTTISDKLSELLQIPFVRFDTDWTDIVSQILHLETEYYDIDVISLFKRLLFVKCAQNDPQRYNCEADGIITNEYYHVLHYVSMLENEQEQEQMTIMIRDMLKIGTIQYNVITFYLYIPTLLSKQRKQKERLTYSEKERKRFAERDKRYLDMLTLADMHIPNFYAIENSGDIETALSQILEILEERYKIKC